MAIQYSKAGMYVYCNDVPVRTSNCYIFMERYTSCISAKWGRSFACGISHSSGSSVADASDAYESAPKRPLYSPSDLLTHSLLFREERGEGSVISASKPAGAARTARRPTSSPEASSRKEYFPL